MTSSVILPAGNMTQSGRGGRNCCHQLVQPRRARRAVAAERGDRFGVAIVNDRLVAVAQQTARNIAAHAPETDDADLHVPNSFPPLTPRFTPDSRHGAFDRGFERGEAGSQIAVKMHPQRAPAAFGKNVEIAAGLRGFHHAETRAVPGNG